MPTDDEIMVVVQKIWQKAISSWNEAGTTNKMKASVKYIRELYEVEQTKGELIW